MDPNQGAPASPGTQPPVPPQPHVTTQPLGQSAAVPKQAYPQAMQAKQVVQPVAAAPRQTSLDDFRRVIDASNILTTEEKNTIHGFLHMLQTKILTVDDFWGKLRKLMGEQNLQIIVNETKKLTPAPAAVPKVQQPPARPAPVVMPVTVTSVPSQPKKSWPVSTVQPGMVPGMGAGPRPPVTGFPVTASGKDKDPARRKEKLADADVDNVPVTQDEAMKEIGDAAFGVVDIEAEGQLPERHVSQFSAIPEAPIPLDAVREKMTHQITAKGFQRMEMGCAELMAYALEQHVKNVLEELSLMAKHRTSVDQNGFTISGVNDRLLAVHAIKRRLEEEVKDYQSGDRDEKRQRTVSRKAEEDANREAQRKLVEDRMKNQAANSTALSAVGDVRVVKNVQARLQKIDQQLATANAALAQQYCQNGYLTFQDWSQPVEAHMNALDAKKKAAQRGGGPPLTLDEERDLQGLVKRFATVQKQQKMLDALRKARTNAQAQDVQPAAAPAPEQAVPKGKAPGQALGILQPAAADTRVTFQDCMAIKRSIGIATLDRYMMSKAKRRPRGRT